MAKGQKRNNREQKKPKQNKVKIAAAVSPFAAGPTKSAFGSATPPRKK